MKKIIVTAIVMLACFTVNAQEQEKKKDNPAPSRGQERAINENGVSVKSDNKKNTAKAKTSQPSSTPEEKKTEEKDKDAKKPD